MVKWYGKYGRNVIRFGKCGRKISLIVKRYGKYGRQVSWKVKRYGRKVSWIVKRYGEKVGWMVKWYGKYRRKMWNDMEIMKEK